jgi:cell division protein ZapA
MTINRDAEENIRKSVKKIEERLKFYEKNYAIKDRQDLLAMCLIEIATKLESVSNSTSKDNKDVQLKLESIESALSKII